MEVQYRALPLQVIASLRVAKLFWREAYQSESIQLDEKKDNRDQNWEFRLKKCHDEAMKILNTHIENRTILPSLRFALSNRICALFKGYHQLFIWKNIYDPGNKIKLLDDSEVYAPDFITLIGTFNDSIFSKRIVDNPNYDIVCRFCLACLYWLEEESKNLWLELHNYYAISNQVFIVFIVLHFHPNFELIIHRILVILHESFIPQNIRNHQEYFWRIIFEIAAEGGFKDAVYSIWLKMSENERSNFKESNKIFELMSISINYPFNQISYFLFCEIEDERMDDLVEWTSMHKTFEPWYNRIFAIEAKSPDTVIKHIPHEVYSGLLTSLAQRIWVFEVFEDIDLFSTLSLNLTDAEVELILLQKVFKCVPDFLEILAKTKNIHALKCIMFKLSQEEQDNFFINNVYGGGITVVNILSKEKEFKMINEYLWGVLMDRKANNEKLRKDASLILQRFKESLPFKLWCEKEACEENVKKVNDQILAIQAELDSLDKHSEEKVGKQHSLSTSSKDENNFPQTEPLNLTVRSTS